MKVISKVLSILDDTANPIAVKELRQAVQSRFVTAILLLFLLGQLTVVGAAVMFDENITRSFDSGRELFSILMSVLLFTCIVFVPIYAGVRLSSERSDTNVDLFFITTIRPGAIIRGKLFAAMVLALLIYGACMPFMTFTYLLRGIDIPSIILTLLLGLLSTAGAVMFSIFVASMALGRFLRIIVGLFLLGVLGMIFSSTMSGSFGIVHFGAGSMASSAEFWGIIATIIIISLSGIGLFYVLGVACLSPPSSNRALPFRIYVPIVWLLNGVVAWLWALENRREEPIQIWLTLVTVLLSFSLFIVISERDVLSRRMKKQIPKTPLFKLPAFLLFSGVTGGIVWWLVLLAATCIVVWLAGSTIISTSSYYSSYDSLMRTLTKAFVFSLYMYCYCMTALLLRRIILPDGRNVILTIIFALLLIILGCIVPVFLAFMCAPGAWDLDDHGYWSMGNPFFALGGDDDYCMSCLAMVVVWGAIISAVQLPWLVKRFVEFIRPQTETPNLPEQS